MGGRFLISLSAENRATAGVAAGRVEVDIELDDTPRPAEVPADLAAALGQDDAARRQLRGPAVQPPQEWVRWVTEAKKPGTRTTRITKTVQSLHEGKTAR